MIRIRQIKINLDSKQDLKSKVSKLLHINENEIKIFNVRYEDNRVCFIYSLAAHRLLVQNEIRCKQLRSSLVSLEKELGIINNEDSYNHGLKVALDQMEIIINSSDNIPKNLKSCAKVILESTPVQNIRNNNDYDIDQLKEEKKQKKKNI